MTSKGLVDHNAAIQDLTKASFETFRCLSIFFHSATRKSWNPFWLSKNKSIYRSVAEQGEVYNAAISETLVMANNGRAICLDTALRLESRLQPILRTAPQMRLDAIKTHNFAKEAQSKLRDVRVNMMQIQTKMLRTVGMPSFEGEDHDLEQFADEDLLGFTIFVLEKTYTVMTDFINWWNDRAVDMLVINHRVDAIQGAFAQQGPRGEDGASTARITPGIDREIDPLCELWREAGLGADDGTTRLFSRQIEGNVLRDTFETMAYDVDSFGPHMLITIAYTRIMFLTVFILPRDIIAKSTLKDLDAV